MNDSFQQLRDAVDAHDTERIHSALAELQPAQADHVFALSFHIQQTRPDLALELIHWVIQQPRPPRGRDGDWLRAHNNGCFLASQNGAREVRLDVARRALAVAADNVPIFHNAACVLCALGLGDEAMTAIRGAVEHEYEHCAAMATDPDLELIRDRPDFRALLLPDAPSEQPPLAIARIANKLNALRGRDRWRNHMMREPASDAALRDFETSAGIELPAEYRAFLRHVGNGGAGRRMLFRLGDEWTDGLSGDLAAPFDPARTDKTGRHDGAIILSHEGDASWVHLVVAGSERGQVWTEANDGTLTPTGQTFAEWYEGWLDERAAELEQDGRSDVIAPYAAVEAPAWAQPWSPEEYARFLRLVQIQMLAAQLGPDFSHAHCGNVYVDGTKFNLRGVASTCSDHPADAWPAIVEEHFSALLAAAPDDPEVLRSLLRARIHRDGHLPDATLQRPFADGLVLTLALDLPTRVESVSSRIAEALALTTDELFALGQANLQRDPQLERVDYEDVDPAILVWTSDSFFSATHVLRLADYVDGETRAQFVVMPSRHTLIVAPADARFNALIGQLILLGHELFESERGSLSPHPYLHREGSFTRIPSGISAEGQPWCIPPAELLALLED